MRDRARVGGYRGATAGWGAALAVLAVSACTSQAAAPTPSVAVTPTVSAQFVTPSALTAKSASTSGSATSPVSAPSVSALPTTPSSSGEAAVTSESASVSPQPTTSLGSILPEVLNPTDPREIADRQAVEAAWIRFWDYYPTFEELSPTEREEIAAAISVDPLKADILRGAANADANGRTGYGTVTHRISWFQNVGGGTITVMADCMDQSTAGSMDKATGKKLSKGFPRENLRGELTFTEGAGWRVRNLYYLTDEEC